MLMREDRYAAYALIAGFIVAEPLLRRDEAGVG